MSEKFYDLEKLGEYILKQNNQKGETMEKYLSKEDLAIISSVIFFATLLLFALGMATGIQVYEAGMENSACLKKEAE